MSVVNIAQGGNKTVKVLGLKELQARVKAIADAAVREDAANIMVAAVIVVRDQIVSNAEAVNLPHKSLEDVYIYTREPGGAGRRDSITALAGLRKAGHNRDAHGYVTWHPRSQTGQFAKAVRTTRRKGTVLHEPSSTAVIGENLATMWEFGTTKMRPQPFFRPAIVAVRNRVLATIADGYTALLKKYSA